jgi:hypothetical protein
VKDSGSYLFEAVLLLMIVLWRKRLLVKGSADIEAETEKNGDGAVKVYGPTGKCGVALAGIPCMLVGRTTANNDGLERRPA